MPHYDYDKDYPFAAFITNLGKYNEGALVGEWVKFPTTAEELKKVFERIGIGAKDDFGQTYEEWFITDYDCYVDGLYDLLGEYANLDELNYLASKLDDMSQDEYERFQAAMEIGDHTGSIQELINLTENLDCYDIYPDIHDHDDLGRYYIEELDAMQVPEHLRNYIDYEAYGRDVALEEGGEFTDLGYVRDTGSSFHEYFSHPEICDCEGILNLFGGTEAFYLSSTDGKPNPYFMPEGKHISDMDALEVARALLAPHEPYQLKTLPKSERNRLLAVLRHRGFTIDQISRLTGIGTNIIQRAK